jgi:cytochrome c oxidase subunit II
MPLNFELNLQSPFSPFQHDIYAFHIFLLVKDLGICSLVVTLTLYTVWRYRRSRNPVPETATHNTVLETLWTILPVMTLVVISIPSFRLLHEYNFFPPAAMTLKVTGHQWYWEYQYPENGNIDVQSVIIPDDQLAPEKKSKRLPEVDQFAVLPTNTTIRTQVVGADVIHSFMVPSLGLQKYAVPGRLNEIWTRIEREGVYYGQCNQICGAGHAFMPIAIRAVSKQRFEAWTDEQQKIASEERERTSPKSANPPPSRQPVTPLPGAVTVPSSKRNVPGIGSIALASLAAEYSPLLRAKEKKVMADLLEGRLHFKYSPKKISVEADSIICRASNVALANRACDLKFGTKTIIIKGRKAHELFATLAEIGAPSSGAAGTIDYSISHVKCAIDPGESSATTAEAVSASLTLGRNDSPDDCNSLLGVSSPSEQSFTRWPFCFRGPLALGFHGAPDGPSDRRGDWFGPDATSITQRKKTQ